ncbi:MAG: energy transducer TonB [Burkholderiales bacterium]
MNGAIQDGVRGNVPAATHAPPQLLAWCLAASLVLHAVVFWGLPGWQSDAAISPAPVLEVVMVTQAAVADPTPLREPPPRIQRRTEQRPRPVLREPAPQPVPQPVPAPVAAPDPEPAISVGNPAEPQPPAAAVVTKPAATIAAVPATASLPLFNAAYLRNPAPVYPAAARRNGDEGTVMLKVLVSPEGAPLRVELDQSSGSGSLDDAALAAVKSWRFVPARRGAQNVEGWVRVPVVFRLES